MIYPIYNTKSFRILFLLVSALLSSCNTTNVIAVNEQNVVESQIVQTKEFNQCDSDKEISAEIKFSKQSSEGSEKEGGGQAKAAIDAQVPLVVKGSLEGAIDAHYKAIVDTAFEHEEIAKITVPSRTAQQYTIVWREIKREGVITYSENGIEKQANYHIRTGLELISTLVKDIPCIMPQPTNTPTTLPPSPTSMAVPPTNAPMPPTNTPIFVLPSPTSAPSPLFTPEVAKCEGVITQSIVDEWRSIGETDKLVTEKYVGKFNQKMTGDSGFDKGDAIPSRKLIATDFGNGESEKYLDYPVKPIVHFHSWGVFETTNEFVASFPGACLTITEEPLVCDEVAHSLVSSPAVPPKGCVLIIEWFADPRCGIILTLDTFDVSANSVGTWWYVTPQRAVTHLAEYKAKDKDSKCEVENLPSFNN